MTPQVRYVEKNKRVLIFSYRDTKLKLVPYTWGYQYDKTVLLSLPCHAWLEITAHTITREGYLRNKQGNLGSVICGTCQADENVSQPFHEFICLENYLARIKEISNGR